MMSLSRSQPGMLQEGGLHALGPHHPPQPGLHLDQQETEPADLGCWECGELGQRSSFSNCWIQGPANHAPFSHFPFLCRKLIFQELLEVSGALEAFSGRSRAAASHRFIKAPLHIHKASSSGLGSHEASAGSHPKAEE